MRADRCDVNKLFACDEKASPFPPLICAARGRGLFLAFDLPDPKTREEFWHGFFDLGVLTLRSGENSIRFRPALDITAEVIDEAVELMRKYCRQRK